MNIEKDYAIDISKPWHVAYWAGVLGVSDMDVVKAVEAVGTSSQAVRTFLNWKPTSINAVADCEHVVQTAPENSHS
jgi:hypothetical protein